MLPAGTRGGWTKPDRLATKIPDDAVAMEGTMLARGGARNAKLGGRGTARPASGRAAV